MFNRNDINFISGGQSGAELAFLQAGQYLGLKTSGFMSSGFQTEDGPKPEYQKEFGLKEAFGVNRTRDIINLHNSDCFIAFLSTNSEIDKDTMSNINCVLTGRRSYVYLNPPNLKQIDQNEAEAGPEDPSNKINSSNRSISGFDLAWLKCHKFRKAVDDPYNKKKLYWRLNNWEKLNYQEKSRWEILAKNITVRMNARKDKLLKDESKIDQDSSVKIEWKILTTGTKPVLILWNLASNRLNIFQDVLYNFLMSYHPKKIMVSGPCRSTHPEIEELITELFINTFSYLLDHNKENLMNSNQYSSRRSCSDKDFYRLVVKSILCGVCNKKHKPPKCVYCEACMENHATPRCYDGDEIGDANYSDDEDEDDGSMYDDD